MFRRILLLLLLASCRRYWVCEATDDARIASLPEHLSATGLFTDMRSEQLAPGVMPYRPEFTLWSDGAEKRRWIWIPPGTTIDTSNLDDWTFPVGTKVWKEFRRDGVRVETRLLTRFGAGDDDWVGLAYVWNENGDATAAPWGVTNARGTPHDVPASGECMACHRGRKSRVLGFSAVQLAARSSHDPDEPDIAALNARGIFTQAIATTLAVPGNPTERAALGYLHANCSHCHNQDRPAHDGARCFDPEKSYDFRLLVGRLDRAEGTPARVTGTGSAFVPGHPEKSAIVDKMSDRGMFRQMPPLATEVVDEQAVATMRAWIQSL